METVDSDGIMDSELSSVPEDVKPNEKTTKRSSKRGRKPSKVDVKVKLERSRQSARECRARKKLRYQYLEELVASRERAIYTLRDELEKMKKICLEIDKGQVTDKTLKWLANDEVISKKGASSTRATKPSKVQVKEEVIDPDDD